MMNKLMHMLILSCEKASYLVDKQGITMLSGMEQVQMKMHLLMCKKCLNYQKQSRFIDQMILNNKINLEKWMNVSLSNEAKTKMKQIINENKH